MRNLSSFVCVSTFALGPVFFVHACQSRDDGSAPRDTTPGAAERAGQQVDQAAHDATDAVGGAASATKGGLEDAARWTRDAARTATSAVGSATEHMGQKIQGK